MPAQAAEHATIHVMHSTLARGTALLTAAALTLCLSSTTAAGNGAKPDLSSAAKAAGELGQLHSLLVSWRGEIIVEHYAPGFSAARLANIKSASKSIMSALVGIAIARGLLKSVNEPVATYLPALDTAPPAKRAITIEDLLTMRSGLESTSGPNYGPWVRSRNWVQYALDRPLVSAPGTTMEYSTGTSHLVSAVLTRVTKVSTWQFAQEALGRPLGISITRWTRDPQGIYLGGNEMLMTPRQMVAFGELFLNRGVVKGRAVVPSDWIDESCTPRTRSRWDPTREYGYGWWIQEVGGHRSCFAWGHGGQYILTFPTLDLVIVVTSSTTQNEDRHQYRERVLRLLSQHVVVPVAATARAAR
jgi:CubicO group peptidase (beta-lactamase class C family)